MPRPKGSKNKPKEGAAATAPAPVGGNLTEETFFELVDTYTNLETNAKSAHAKFRAHVKKCEEAGIDVKALKAALKIGAEDRLTRIGHFKNLSRYLNWLEVPVGEQFGMFSDEDTGANAEAAGDEAFEEDSDEAAAARHEAVTGNATAH